VKLVDLRSDTVTQPTPAMRRAMADAPVGDDVYGEDPTVRALEERVASLLGKEAALFVPSGTMANQLAIGVHARPGDELYAAEGSHCVWYESGAAAALFGVQVKEVGAGGSMTAEQLDAAVRERADYAPLPRLLVLENTHNRGGGSVLDAEATARLAQAGRSRGLAVHLDGARLWNATRALGVAPAELTREADTVSVCFSKGLGAPIGSAVAGPRELIGRAHRLRKMLGGGMRQVGVLAAAALHALEHHVTRLDEDHAHARALAASLRDAGLDAREPATNIVMVDLDPADPAPSAAQVVEAARSQGVLVSAFGPRRLRAVTHLDVDAADVRRAARVLVECVQTTRSTAST
jgi:threonine aldolase